MVYREEDYDSVHERIIDNLQVDYEEWKEKLVEYKNNFSAVEIIKQKIEKVKKIANKIRPN